MTSPAPLVDPRTAEIVSREVQELLAVYAPEWGEVDPSTGRPKGLSGALIGIFSRYAELIIQRLNQTPNKNILAFLDMLGMSLLPPQPARVPVTFFLVAGSASPAVVPAGTQVAAPPSPDAKEPVLYETERELVVTTAQLAALFARQPAADTYADNSLLAASTVENGLAVFGGDTPIEHMLYLGDAEFFGHPALKQLRLYFELVRAIQNPDPRTLSWEIWDGLSGTPLAPVTDGTASLTNDGIVIFDGPLNAPVRLVNGMESRWLRCRLQTPITPAQDVQAGAVRAAQLPKISRLRAEAYLGREGQRVEYAFANFSPVDLSKNFFPFGERPRVGDALYLSHDEAFASQGATVQLSFDASTTAGNPAAAFPALRVRWEFWNGEAWTELGTSQADSNGTGTNFQDTSRAFTQQGVVSFTFPQTPQRTIVNGVGGYWVRARISAGDYGREALYTLKTAGHPEEGYVLTPATFAPPSVASVTLDYSVTKSAQSVDFIITLNDFSYSLISSDAVSFSPFAPTRDQDETLYLGMLLPPQSEGFPNRTVSLYLGMLSHAYGAQPDNASPSAPPLLVWEYWNGAWTKLVVIDETENLTRAGLIEFLAPPDFQPHAEFNLNCYWLRARLLSGEYLFTPRLRAALLNTTVAVQAITVRDEVLGSSDASAGQHFRATQTPVLAGQQLLVREGDLPSASERAASEAEEGPDSVLVKMDQTGRPQEVWVRWHEVPDFYGSGPRDRHYMLDHMSGEVSFGDGVSGMIPPRGASSLRLTYRSGGGTRGNKGPRAVTELRTTIPYVDRIVNLEPALGGAEAESYDSLIERAPRSLRHRDRAVTVQDYEDLAMLASPQVARAKGVPLFNLEADPGAVTRRPGFISVIVVPRTSEARPLPDLELINTVREFLDQRRASASRLAVVGPEYVRVSVTAEVVPVSMEGISQLEADVKAALSRFLHPLTGGVAAQGWDFGRSPYKSDIYALIEGVPGVDYVRRLDVTALNERTGELVPVDVTTLSQPPVFEKNRFLVYSGTHRVTFTFGEA